MKQISFPFPLFFALFVSGALITFFSANSASVTTHKTPAEMITPFPVALELKSQELQVVNAEQLQKLQLPDPETNKRMKPSFLLSDRFFVDGEMETHSIVGASITNGNAITIPTDYSAQVSGRILDDMTQEIIIVYGDKAEEDQIITAIYTANADQYFPQTQYIKNILVWKTIFMNGMTASLILPFIICKFIVKRKQKKLTHES